MLITLSLLCRARPENLERLARALGVEPVLTLPEPLRPIRLARDVHRELERRRRSSAPGEEC